MRYKVYRRHMWILVQEAKSYLEMFTEPNRPAPFEYPLYVYRRKRGRIHLDNTGLLMIDDLTTRTCWLEMALLRPEAPRPK
jgi:hypothetical protein